MDNWFRNIKLNVSVKKFTHSKCIGVRSQHQNLLFSFLADKIKRLLFNLSTRTTFQQFKENTIQFIQIESKMKTRNLRFENQFEVDVTWVPSLRGHVSSRGGRHVGLTCTWSCGRRLPPPPTRTRPSDEQLPGPEHCDGSRGSCRTWPRCWWHSPPRSCVCRGSERICKYLLHNNLPRLSPSSTAASYPSWTETHWEGNSSRPLSLCAGVMSLFGMISTFGYLMRMS